jgi:hypothetical protein
MLEFGPSDAGRSGRFFQDNRLVALSPAIISHLPKIQGCHTMTNLYILPVVMLLSRLN